MQSNNNQMKKAPILLILFLTSCKVERILFNVHNNDFQKETNSLRKKGWKFESAGQMDCDSIQVLMKKKRITI